MHGLPLMQVALACLLTIAPGQAAPVRTAKEAKTIAEQETQGLATSARRIALNGATGGWEVVVHMPGEPRGWRCVVDNDTHTVFTKTRIPNPEAPRRKGP